MLRLALLLRTDEHEIEDGDHHHEKDQAALGTLQSESLPSVGGPFAPAGAARQAARAAPFGIDSSATPSLYLRTDGRREVLGKRGSYVSEGGLGCNPASRGPADEPELHRKGLVYVLDRVRLFTDRHGQRRQPHGTPEQADQRFEDRPVDLVEAPLVDLEELERGFRGCPVDMPGPPDLGEVSGPAQKAVRYARRAAGATGYLVGALGVYLDAQDLGGPGDDLLQVLGRIRIRRSLSSNLLRRGPVMSPARVVAPTRVAQEIEPDRVRARPCRSPGPAGSPPSPDKAPLRPDVGAGGSGR